MPILKRESEIITRYWTLSLGLGLVVIGAVALLLEILVRTAQQIETGAGQIWTVGQLIANNTVHVPLLHRTNQIVDEISQTADGIAAATQRIARVTDAGSDGS